MGPAKVLTMADVKITKLKTKTILADFQLLRVVTFTSGSTKNIHKSSFGI